LVLILTLVFFIAPALSGRSVNYRLEASYALHVQDTVDRQLLLNGRVWRNLYYKVRGTQFMFTDTFLNGDIVINGKIFRDCGVKYDLLNDELLTMAGHNIIIQLNKEMVKSFTINYNQSTLNFVKLDKDSINDLNGYVNVLYQGNDALYVKYRKVILLLAVDNKYDEFNQTQKIYVKKDGRFYPVGNKNDVIDLYSAYRQQIKNYIRINRLKVSKSNPESFIPLIKFCDKLGH